ncbi:MAG: hypothetical protein G01um101472_144 [Parcubacteria group bacterium Gr01-1014_72]|nr:MAG: hypothetical protein G01um101472_144 [Parcubacteria group bacterium Gr01-1014_72]
MYRICTTSSFRNSFEKLPASLRRQAVFLIGILAVDYRDPRLHTKKLHGNRVEYSFRLHRDYRCVFCFEDGETVLLLTIAHRKDIYR